MPNSYIYIYLYNYVIYDEGTVVIEVMSSLKHMIISNILVLY